MCGRVYNTLTPNQLLRAAGTHLIRNANRVQNSYNIGPTTYVPAVRHHSSAANNHRELDMVKWGYQAPFGQFIINARVEEAMEKKTFKPLVNTSRCVMIVQGYFEWTPNKEPYLFRPKENKQVKKEETEVKKEEIEVKTEEEERKDDIEVKQEDTGDKKDDDNGDVPPVMYIAGLIAPDDTLILLTREALRGFDGGFSDVHERMPVLLDESEIDMWLDCEKYKFEKILFSEILNEKKEKWNQVFRYQVGPLVNSIRNKSDKLILTLEDYKKELDKTGIKKFFQPAVKKEKPKPEEKKEEQKVTPNDKEPAKKDNPSDTQPTQAIQATQSTDPGNEDKTDVERAQEEAKKKVVIDDEEETGGDPNLGHVQDTLDRSGLGKNEAGFKATEIHVMTRKAGNKGDKEEEGSGTKGSKKRKDVTNKDEVTQENRKQVKKNPQDEDENEGSENSE